MQSNAFTSPSSCSLAALHYAPSNTPPGCRKQLLIYCGESVHLWYYDLYQCVQQIVRYFSIALNSIMRNIELTAHVITWHSCSPYVLARRLICVMRNVRLLCGVVFESFLTIALPFWSRPSFITNYFKFTRNLRRNSPKTRHPQPRQPKMVVQLLGHARFLKYSREL